MDWDKIGLKCGIEIHQQLNTKSKLFCRCRSDLSKDKPIGSVFRKLKPVSGETGEVDISAAHELLKNKEFEYIIYQEESCEVETDEEPPHQMNPDALSIALQISVMLNCSVPDQLFVMRKTIIDGSNTSGFQRTAIIGVNGFMETGFGKVGITNLSVEEDSAQIISREGNKTVYGLDRLGIPLVEIGTNADIKTPEQAKEAAERLGLIIRSTNSVKRGLGTIRQDVNVSVKNGNRVEIKGAQDLRALPKIVEIEANRQLKLIQIHEKVKGLRESEASVTDLSEIFRQTKSKLISGILSSGGKIFGAGLNGFSGLLGIEIQSKKRFGTEVSEYAKTAGVKGLIHSDEDLKGKYGIEEDEVKRVKNILKCADSDAFILVGDKEDMAKVAVSLGISRANSQIHIAVPKEVRKAEEDGTTTFLRPLAGAARLYPETDVLPIKIDEKILGYLKNNLPELWEDKIERFVRDYKINKDVATQLVKSDKSDIFEKIAGLRFDPNLVFRALTSMISEIKGEGVETENLSDESILEVFKKSPKTISKEALYTLLRTVAKTGKIEKIEDFSETDLRKTIKQILLKNKDAMSKHNPEQVLMGEVMKEIRGKASGNLVMKILKEEIGKK